MKRYNNLYGSIIDKDNIRLAHKNARKGKTSYTEVREVDDNVEKYVDILYSMLSLGTYSPSRYTMFKKNDKGKIREIYKLPYFPDRIVHHAILQVLEPIWKKVLIKQTYQSIRGRGVTKCKRDLEKALGVLDYKSTWCVKIDVEKFYPSVDNSILKIIVAKKIKCYKTLGLLYKIIDSMQGLPIGNYISQYLGNLYLAYMDHYILNIPSVLTYSRYCDDIVVIVRSKANAQMILAILHDYLKDKLKLKIKSNKQYFCIMYRGIDYVGFVFTSKGVRLRKTIVSKFKRASRVNDDLVMSSYYGWLLECHSATLWLKYYKGSKVYGIKESYRLRA